MNASKFFLQMATFPRRIYPYTFVKAGVFTLNYAGAVGQSSADAQLLLSQKPLLQLGAASCQAS